MPKFLIPKPGDPYKLATVWCLRLCVCYRNSNACKFFLRDPKMLFNQIDEKLIREAGYNFLNDGSKHFMLVPINAGSFLFVDGFTGVKKAWYKAGRPLFLSCRAHLTEQYDYGKIRFEALLDNLNEVEVL
jgi:hypothetical protein